MSQALEEGVQALVALGFTGLEAEVYAALLERSPSTGYRVAQTIGKPAANVYKAIESLEGKGAVLVDDGSSRMCRAVPPEELLSRLERSFAERRQRAGRALNRLGTADNDDRVYQLKTAEQVFERARQMLARSTDVVILDVFPLPLETLRGDVEEAAARGVTVAMKTYAPAGVSGAEVIVAPNGATIMDRWPGQWINLVVDGEEHLIALLDGSGSQVRQAVWSGSPYLSWVYHSAVSSELILSALVAELERGTSSRRLLESLARYEPLKANHAPGYTRLLERFRDTGPGDDSDEV
jgi:sugar-specific transcriptional regulator TrmB